MANGEEAGTVSLGADISLYEFDFVLEAAIQYEFKLEAEPLCPDVLPAVVEY